MSWHGSRQLRGRLPSCMLNPLSDERLVSPRCVERRERLKSSLITRQRSGVTLRAVVNVVNVVMDLHGGA